MGLKREDILSGAFEQRLAVAERQGLLTCLTPAAREVSKQTIINAIGDDEVWIFGYGSLIWNPCIYYTDRQPARIDAFHRSYCLSTPLGRGTPEQPGLMLGLEPGGACEGVAFQIAADVAEQELDVVWRREMVSGAYQPQLLDATTPLGVRRVIAFVINPDYSRYIAQLPPDECAAIIATARGWIGSCAEYLYSTVEHLEELGIRDEAMHELRHLVQQYQARHGIAHFSPEKS